MQDQKLYLIFEYLQYDLKKYIDTEIPSKEYMEPMLVKVHLCVNVVGGFFCVWVTVIISGDFSFTGQKGLLVLYLLETSFIINFKEKNAKLPFSSSKYDHKNF